MGLPRFPPANFDAVIEAYAQGNAVAMPLLAYFDFLPTPAALWGGEYDITSGGVTWKGFGQGGMLISVEGLDNNSNLDGSDTTVTLSGVNATVMSLAADEDRSGYVGRLAAFYAQFCDLNYQPLCPPYAIRAGVMGPMVLDKTIEVRDKGDIQSIRSIKLPVWNMFSGRGNAPAGLQTDRDQQIRYPGDKFFSFVPSLQDKTIPVPWR